MKWISVKERLPEKPHQSVLVTDGRKINIAHLGWDLKTWYDHLYTLHHDHICSSYITHWMPLPEPPNE